MSSPSWCFYWFVYKHVLCWTCNCHPWCCLSHDLLISKALHCREQLMFLKSSREVLYIYHSFSELFYISFLFWTAKSFWAFRLPWELGSPPSCLFVLTGPAPESFPSGQWNRAQWNRAQSQAEALGADCQGLSTVFTCDLWGTLIVVPGSFGQYIFNHGWI